LIFFSYEKRSRYYHPALRSICRADHKKKYYFIKIEIAFHIKKVK